MIKRSMIIALIICLAISIYGSSLTESLIGFEDSINRIIELIDQGETDEALKLIEALGGNLNTVKSEILKTKTSNKGGRKEINDNGDELEVIIFTNAELEKEVRNILGITKGDIYKNDVLLIADLELDTNNLKGLENFQNLVVLDAGHGEITNLEPINGLVELQKLSLSYNEISDISPLENLVNLEVLYLSGNKIRDITPLEKLKKLKYLALNKNRLILNDISCLLELPELYCVNIENCNVKDEITIETLIAKGVDVVR